MFCFSIVLVTLTNIYFRFNLKLDKFGVDIQVLKDPVILREFVGWKEDWERELKKKNCSVVEVHFLTKYKYLLFLFEDNNKVCTIFEGNMEYHHGKTGCWMLIGECSDEYVEDEDFYLLLSH